MALLDRITTVTLLAIVCFMMEFQSKRYFFTGSMVPREKNVIREKIDELTEDYVPAHMLVNSSNHFKDFASKIIKLIDLLKPIHQQPITMFGDVKFVKIVPYCIPEMMANKNDHICFKNTEVHYLENLKLVNIEFGRRTIRAKEKNSYLYVTHVFDKLLINGTSEFEDVCELDKYNTKVLNGELIIYRDYEISGYFNLEIPFYENIKHAESMHFEHIHAMQFYLPVQGFNGILKQLENEVNIPSIFFPKNMTFNCKVDEKNGTDIRTMFIVTEDIIYKKHLNYDVFNKVEFIERGDSFYTRFAITFNDLVFKTKIAVKINGILKISEYVIFHINELQVQVVYMPNQDLSFSVEVLRLKELTLYTYEKVNPFYSPIDVFNGQLSYCIRTTIIHSVEKSLYISSNRVPPFAERIFNT